MQGPDAAGSANSAARGAAGEATGFPGSCGLFFNLTRARAGLWVRQDAVRAAKRTRGSTATIDTLRKDAQNQKAIMAKKGKKSSGKGPSEAVANSMTPHLAMHSTRGVESGRGRRELKKQKDKYQKTVYGVQALPPDEATPFFTTYVLHYAFPTIAIICTCLGCVLLRTMKMYQKERWKGTSYFHGNSFPAAA